jgi:hypothetical protein
VVREQVDERRGMTGGFHLPAREREREREREL